MRETLPTHRARSKRQALVATVFLLFVGCSDKQKPTSEKTPTTEQSAPATSPAEDAQMAAPSGDAQSGPASIAEGTTPATDADVEFVRGLCKESGFNEEQCACSMQHAKEMLSAELLKKLRESPAEDDPKLLSYFSAREMTATMAWVEKVDVVCGLAEPEPIQDATLGAQGSTP